MRAQQVLPASDRRLAGGAGKPSSTGGLRLGGCSSGSAGAEGGSWLPGTGGCGREGTGDIRLGTHGLEHPLSKPNPTARLFSILLFFAPFPSSWKQEESGGT